MNGMNVVGGPFAGKTTLVNQLSRAGVRAVDFDEEFARHDPDPANKELKRAWRPESPLHDEWLRIAALVNKELLRRLRGGEVVTSHDVVPGWEGPVVEIRPSIDTIRERAAAAADPSRADAADRYYKNHPPQATVVTASDDVVEMITRPDRPNRASVT